MKNNHNLIHLPELSLSLDSLKSHLKNIYKIDINMSNIDYAALEKTNVWGLYSEDIRTIEEEGSFEANHWVFSKVGNEYEAVYDGLYMHVFGSLEDLMARQNEIGYYEYNSDKSEENGEETFVDANGNEREYKEFAADGKKIDAASFKAPKGYKRLGSGRMGSILHQKLISNGVDAVEIPDPKIKGYVTIYIRREAKNIEKAKNVIGGKSVAVAAKGTQVPEKIKVAFYKWGEYQEDEEIDLIDLPETILGEDDLSGFNIREEDVDKIFYASDLDIDSDEEGTSVKRSYATNYVKASNGKKILQDYYKDKQSGEIFTEQEMLEAVDNQDNLDSFYLIGKFESKEEAANGGGGVSKEEIDEFIYEYGGDRKEVEETLKRRKARLSNEENQRLKELNRKSRINELTDSEEIEFDKLVHKYRGWEYKGGKAANGVSLDDTLESIKAYDFRNQKTYVFSVGTHVKWIQAARVLSGKIIAIKKPKHSANNHNEWSVHVKSDVSGKTLYTKVYFLLNEYNKFAINDKLPFDKKNSERIAFIGELMAEGERINDEEDVMEMRADIADVNESTSEQKQFWVINSLIDFVQHSPKIDYFVKRAKELGLADQYAANGKSIGSKKWRKMETYQAEKGKWFKEAVMEKEPFTLGGWRKNLPAGQRRSLAIHSRSGSKHDRYISAGRALQALANVTKDADTKKIANQDAEYFFTEGKKFADGGGGIKSNKIAEDILSILGGANKLNAMTGAYNFISLPNGLSFRIKNPAANFIKITITSMDLYDLEVGRIRGDKYTVIETKKGIYDDMLRPAIEKATGMYLSMGTMGRKAANGTMLRDKYELGDMYSPDFDYGGMFDMVLKVNSDWTVEDLTKLKNSLVDVNYTPIAIALGAGISFMESGDKINANVVFNKVRHLMKKEMVEQYVDRYMNDDMSVIFDTIGMDMPVELEGDEYHQTMDDARQVANAYFMKHPEEMKNKFGEPYKFAKGGPVNGSKVSDFEESETVTVDGKEYKVRLSYNLRLNSTNINVIDNTGYPCIEKVPFQVMTKLHSMFDRLIHAYLEKGKTWKAADGAEIDALVNDWKAIKSVLSSPSSSEIDLEKIKILDIETNTVHNPIFFDFEEKIVIMENSEFGRTRNDFGKVKVFVEGQTPSTVTKKVIDKVLSPAEMMRQKGSSSSPIVGAPIIEETSSKQPVITKVDPTTKNSVFPKVLQEMWAEAKGSGVVLISPEYMQKIEEALMSSNISSAVYRSMVDEISYWLDVNQVLLRSKPFMKKVRETLRNNPA